MLGRDGQFSEVKNLYENIYLGDMVTITPGTLAFPFSVTPEHRVLAFSLLEHPKAHNQARFRLASHADW